MEGKYYKEYNDIKEHLWNSPERDKYIEFANELNNIIDKSFRAKRLQNDIANIVDFYKSMPKNIQLYYLYMLFTHSNKKRLIILPYLMTENIKYINFSKDEEYAFRNIFNLIKDEHFSNQNLIILLIGIQNLLPYIFLYTYNTEIIHIITLIIDYCINIQPLKYLSRSIAISMLNHIRKYNINIDVLDYNYYKYTIELYNNLFQENVMDIDIFEFCIYILSKTNNYRIYNRSIHTLISYINYLFQDYDEYNELYNNINIKVMFCNVIIKHKNELVNNLERICMKYNEMNIIENIKQNIIRCEGFLTLVDMK